MSALEQLSQAEAYKEDGNKHYSEGNYKRALGAYHKVFCYVNGLQVPPNGQTATPSSSSHIPKDRVDDLQKLKQSTKLNMAACYLKTGDHQKCIDACTAALDLGTSAKAYFRRAQAHSELNSFSSAISDLERARGLSEEDGAAIEAELKKVRRRSMQADEVEKKRYANMFSKAQAPESNVPAEPDPPPVEAAAPVECKLEKLAEPSAEVPVSTEKPVSNGVKATGDTASASGTTITPTTSEVQDDIRKLDVTVRELTYAWQQTDEDIKIYVSFDQSEELEGGVDESRVQVEFGEWSALLVINSTVEGRAPLGLRLADFHRRLAPEKCRCTVRSTRITLKLVKQEKEHWWNLLQRAPMNAS